MMVVTLLMASERLLTASRMTAIDPVAKPTKALNAASTKLARMPMALVRMMVVSLVLRMVPW